MAAISWWRLNDLPGSSTLADALGTQALWPDGFGGTLRYAQPGYNEYASLRLLPDGSYPTLYAYLTTHALSSAAGTVMLWLRPDVWAEDAVTRTIFYLLNASSQKVAAVVEDSALKVTVNNKFGTVTPVSHPDDTWLHLAVTWDGTIGKIYVNGVKWLEDITSVTAMSANVSALYLGTDNTTSNKFQGFLQDVKYYTHALTAAQIQRDIEASTVNVVKRKILRTRELQQLRKTVAATFGYRGAIQRNEFEQWRSYLEHIPMGVQDLSPRSGTDDAGSFSFYNTFDVRVTGEHELPKFPFVSARFVVAGKTLEAFSVSQEPDDVVVAMECRQL